jgi:hypothetical protein
MEANPVTTQTEAPAVAPEAEQVEQAPADQQAPLTPDIEAIDGEDRGQFVRKAALYEERQRRKEATERSREWERRYMEGMQKAQDRLDALYKNAQQGVAQQQPQAPSIPSLEEDPIGHFKAQNDELKRQVQEQAEWRKSQDQRSQQTTQVQQIAQDIQRQESEFAKVNPDYFQAHEHLQNSWVAEAKAMGIPDHEIPEAIRARSIETVQIASRLGRNPAEVAYQRAQAIGYKKQNAPAAVGERLLLARRLVESGVRFVTVNYGSWDSHVDIKGTCNEHMPALDHALTGLITDLEQRGLLDSTLVMVTTEFGRTPKVNSSNGRDHWARVYSMLLAGGGLTRGQIYGASDATSSEPSRDAVPLEDFLSTVYHQLGIDSSVRLPAFGGTRPIDIVKGGKPVKGLIA